MPGTVPSHPRSHRPARLTVAQVVAETADSVSLVFDVPEDRAPDFEYSPGQFLTIQVPSLDRDPVARCYSLASAYGIDDRLKVTVKRTADGYASNWLCDNATPGTTFEMLPPSGTFVPSDLNAQLVCFAGGSGITPMMSIIKSVLMIGSGSVRLVYANRDRNSIIFGDELATLAEQYGDRLTLIHWLDAEHGIPGQRDLLDAAQIRQDDHIFICGPTAFMDSVHDGLHATGHNRKLIHIEVFTSLAGDPFAEHVVAQLTTEQQHDAAQVEVELDGQTHTLTWPRSQSLVDVMLDAGLDVPYSCLGGECGSCTCTVQEGKTDMVTCEILDPEDVADGYLLGCQARPVSDFIRISF